MTKSFRYLFLFRLTTAFILFQFLLSCGGNKSAETTSTAAVVSDTGKQISKLEPVGPKPAWGQDITDPMQVIIEKLVSYGAPPLISLSAIEARKQPSPAMAAMDVTREHNIPIPPVMVDTTGKNIPVSGGSIHVRIYTPKTGKNNYPLIVYYHGGGWVIADLDTYNSSAEAMSAQAEAVVVSVAYRQGPENKFPTAHNDSYAAYEWAVKNAASLKADSSRVAVVGESAGGNLAAAVSMMARDKGFKLPLHEVLVYPIANYDTASESYLKYAEAKPLNKPLMGWFFNKYLRSANDGKSPMISLVNANLKGMPPTTIISAELDPLQSEGKLLADKLKSAGVNTAYQLYNGVTHEFFGMATLLPEARQAQALAASALKNAFTK